MWACQDTTYDEGENSGVPSPAAGWPTTVKTYSNCANQSSTTITAYSGYDLDGNPLETVDGVGTAHASFYGSTGISGKNGCTLPSAPAIKSSAWSKSNYTTCAVYNGNALPTSLTNAFGQTTSITYDATQGELPINTTDANSQKTSYSYSYDASGNLTVETTEPQANYAYTTESTSYSTCTSSSSLPCFELKSNAALYPTAVSETFYDALGRAVETRTPGPTSGDDTIQFTVYNDQAHTSFTSVPFEVAAGTGWIDPNGATDINGHTPAGTTSFYDALGRVIAVQDPIFGSPGVPGISCPSLGSNATACTVYMLASPQGSSTLYETQEAIDPNNHVTRSYVDMLGNTRYVEYDSGVNGGSLSVNEQVATQYNALNEPTQVTTTDLAPQSGQSITSVTTSMQYDDLGRLTKLVDPDRGTHTYTYDADGQVLSDTSGTRVIGYNDDLLGRLGCVEEGAATSDADGSCTSGTTSLIVYTYDTSQLGTAGSTDFPIGRLTKSEAITSYPEGGSTKSNEKYQYDARGRLITEQLRFPTLPTSWNLSLPTYQLSQSYNDAGQPTTTTTSVVGQSGLGYSFTQTHDSTLGMLTGLSTNGSLTTPNLASLSYNVNALISSIATQSSTGSSLASEAFSYDGDLRPVEAQATWQSGSGQSGTFFDQAQGYDPASNVETVTTTMNQPNGQAGSYSETQNFCYDEQNRLVWAGNSGTQPAAGNGTCGSGTLTSGFPGGSYSSSFVYTHLGQLWQGPLAGSGTNQQYLYCTSSTPHQLKGLYPLGATCSSPGSASYATSYDSWGNVTSRTYNSQTARLSYNPLDEMVEWQVPSTNQAWYAYDAAGNRTLQRTTIGSTTSVTVYPFGLEEYTYDGSGTLTSSTHYYMLAGRLIGELTGLGTLSTNFFLTDGLGSVLGVFSNTAGSAALLSEQLFAPYGVQRTSSGNAFSQYTTKGFTGQYNDSVSGLDYYTSRYYDPIAGVFLSADKKQGNQQGKNPYAYVGGNPETKTDPTGQYFAPPPSGNGGPPPSCVQLGTCNSGNSAGYGNPPPPQSPPPLSGTALRLCHLNGGCSHTFGPPPRDVLLTLCEENTACRNWMFNQSLNQTLEFFTGVAVLIVGGVELLEFGGSILAMYALTHPEEDEAVLNELDVTSAEAAAEYQQQEEELIQQLESEGILDQNGEIVEGACSFTAQTAVATKQGKQSIGKLHIGEQVWAYNPKTHRMELEPIEHVWVHTDNDLVDLIITTKTRIQHGKASPTGSVQISEVIHTNQKHPFLTLEKGFLPVNQIKLGMHILRADGGIGVVSGWKVVPGTEVMYNLEVAHDHTFVVGVDEWVVHNDCGPTLPTNPGQVQHIFRNQPGHFVEDTPGNRQLIIDTASELNNYVGTDRYGNDVYTLTLPDGKQVWVSVRNNVIQNAGINEVPWTWDPLSQRLVPPSSTP